MGDKPLISPKDASVKRQLHDAARAEIDNYFKIELGRSVLTPFQAQALAERLTARLARKLNELYKQGDIPPE
jgi:hypothetical protein